jgi:hypothetical protein
MAGVVDGYAERFEDFDLRIVDSSAAGSRCG